MGDPFFKVTSEDIRSGSRIRADKSIERALFRVGVLVKMQAKANILNRGVVMTRTLHDSIDFRIDRLSNDDMELVFHARNVSYAHISEFGSNNMTDKMRRAMFARMRDDPGGIPKMPGKGVVPKDGGVYFGRKWLRDAMDGHTGQIMAFLRDAIQQMDIIERV